MATNELANPSRIKRYQFDTLAGKVKDDLVSLVTETGFHEYFDPRPSEQIDDEAGCGGDHFSWTAASVIGPIIDFLILKNELP